MRLISTASRLVYQIGVSGVYCIRFIITSSSPKNQKSRSLMFDHGSEQFLLISFELMTCEIDFYCALSDSSHKLIDASFELELEVDFVKCPEYLRKNRLKRQRDKGARR